MITTSNALRCSKNRLPLDKDNVIQRSFSIFERVCRRTFQFFSFDFSFIDVQHRSGFRPLRRASTKKYQPSASWCWFGTHVQNCCYWKKALLRFSFNHNVLKLIQTQHSVQFLFHVQFLFQLHFRGFRNISLILI